MKAAIYARVATADQSIEAQIAALRHEGEQRGLEIIKEYTDRGISGLKARRRGLDTLLEAAKKKEFDLVLVSSIDRVARSSKHLGQIMGELDGLGIRFVSLRESIDTADAAGRVFIETLRNIAALEKSLGGERIKVGMRRAQSEGQRLGRQPLNVDHAAIVRDRLDGLSLTKVAQKHSISKASVVRFFRKHQKQFAVA
jgi:DNA invertase Pin-like site-specific DNA recombinase